MNLRLRLNILITALLLLFMLAVAVMILRGTKASIQEGVEAASRVTVQLLDTVIISSDQNPGWGYTHDVMRRFLQHLGHVRGNEIYLYGLNGQLLYQTPPSKYKSSEKPPQWFVTMLDPHEKSVTRSIRFGRLEIVPNPAGAIRESWSKMRSLFWLGIAFFLLLNTIVYWMLGRWLRPIPMMMQSIKQVGQGDLSARMPTFNLPEFNSIAQNFNSMGDSLQLKTQENQRLALVAQQTADAVMIHDLDGKITFWNAAAEKIFGYSSAEILGKHAHLLAPKEQIKDLAQNLRTINDKQNVEIHDTQRLSRDGRLIDVSISAAPLIDPLSQQVIGDICSMRDITERKKAEEAERKLEENRQITHLIQQHIEDERRSLARELHDELGQYVTAIKTFAVAIANKTKTKAPEVEASAQTIVAAANHIYDGMHNIIRMLRPGSLDNLGLVETLKDAIHHLQTQNPSLNIVFETSGPLKQLGETFNINLYRIVQESLNNAIKHAKASNILIKLSITKNGDCELLIEDDGVGMNFNEVDQTNHFGLLGIRERAQGLRGSFTLDSGPSKGTKIAIHIPQAIQKD